MFFGIRDINSQIKMCCEALLHFCVIITGKHRGEVSKHLGQVGINTTDELCDLYSNSEAFFTQDGEDNVKHVGYFSLAKHFE